MRGSARGGRIVLEDVRAYIQRLQRVAAAPKRAAAAEAAPAKPPPEPMDFSKWGPVTKKPLLLLRKVIARRMRESWHATPRVTQFDEADITALMDLRKQYAPAYEKKGARLTLTSFALKVVAETLKKHPVFNTSLDEAAERSRLQGVLSHRHGGGHGGRLDRAGDARRGQEGHADALQELKDLAKKARERKVSLEELKGGTFTISNQGGIGGAHFTPIINQPEMAILGLGRGALQAGGARTRHSTAPDAAAGAVLRPSRH